MRLLLILCFLLSRTSAFRVIVPRSSIQQSCQEQQHHQPRSLASPLWMANENDGTKGGALGKPSYSNDAFFAWHMQTQRQKIRDYVAMDTYVDTNKLWNLAWHDSFVRNGLSDFVPPLTDTLNVLVVGEDTDETLITSPDFEDEPTVTSSAKSESRSTSQQPQQQVVVEDEDGKQSIVATSSSTPSQDSSCSFLSAILDDDVDENDANTSALGFETYDCIMDRGVMAALQSSLSSIEGAGELSAEYNQNVGRLLLEVTKRIREHGVYVMQTNGPLPESSKQYLLRMGELLGLQWQFELDGISDDNVCVNVARKYFKDELPSVGKLAKA